MDRTELLERVALRLGRQDGSLDPALGAMATLIAPHLALTTYDPGADDPAARKGGGRGGEADGGGLVVGSPFTSFSPATVLAHDPEVGVAVVHVHTPFVRDVSPGAFSGTPPRPGDTWEVYSLTALETGEEKPAVTEARPQRHTGGILRALRSGNQAVLRAEPGLPPGSEGAPVMVHGQVVGLVRRRDGDGFAVLPLTAILTSSGIGSMRADLPFDEKVWYEASAAASAGKDGPLAAGGTSPAAQDDGGAESVAGSHAGAHEPGTETAAADAAREGERRKGNDRRKRAGRRQGDDERPAQSAREDKAEPAEDAAETKGGPVRHDVVQEGETDAETAVETDAEEAVEHIFMAGYRPDDVHAAAEDLLDLGREIDALAAVLAARDTQPPLSLGLFGDWGTGKSFFMKKLQARIRDLTAYVPADASSPFCEHIYQIEFNAWHFIDADLWASLTAEIFEGLAREMDPASRVGKRLVEKAAAAQYRQQVTDAQDQAQVLQQEVEEIEGRLAGLEAHEPSLADLLSPRLAVTATRDYVLRQPEVQQTLHEVEDVLHLKPARDQAGEVKQEVMQLLATGTRAQALWLSVRHARPQDILTLALLVGVGVVLILGVVVKDWAPVGEVVATVVAIVTPLLEFVRRFRPRVERAMDRIEAARAVSERLVNERQGERDAERAALRAQLGQALQRAEQANAHAAELAQKLAQLRADRQFFSYIQERFRSTDYTQHFGTVARARNDFEQLSALLARVQEEVGDAEGDAPGAVRIILYIDDLDRCPESKVMDVLQAVHLLLAFPLFVVVVGVDSRWLVHSLRQHHAVFKAALSHHDDLPDEERLHWQSTPLNYLEKIFQIPFALRPMDQDGFGRLIDDLTEDLARPAATLPSSLRHDPNVGPIRADASSTAGGDGDAAPTLATLAVSPDPALPAEEPARTVEAQEAAQQEVEQTTQQEAQQAVQLEVQKEAQALALAVRARHLQITPHERAFMKALHSFIGSPRAAKRFVNLYRLIRVLVDERQLPSFVGDARHGAYRHALLLLAIQTGFPQESAELIRALLDESPDQPWWMFVDGLIGRELGRDEGGGDAETERWRQLNARLDEARAAELLARDVSCGSLATWARRVVPYSFGAGRVLATR